MEYVLIAVLVALALIIIASCVKVVPQANAYVVERLGGYQATWGVGIHFKVPIIDRVAKRVLLKEQVTGQSSPGAVLWRNPGPSVL